MEPLTSLPADDASDVDWPEGEPPGWSVSSPERSPSARSGIPEPGQRLRAVARALAHPVPLAMLVAVTTHLLWAWLVASSGGDLAAQDAWAEFARAHPGSAYNLAWYGGVHPVSYSVLSPYVMATFGVRTTMVVVGTLSAGLLALLMVRSRDVRHPVWPALFGTLAVTGNAVSGRVTFGLGLMFGLAAVAVIFVWPERWRSEELRHRLTRAGLAATLSVLATASSPVAGLFVGVAAASLWLTRRRWAAYAIGVPPVLVVVFSALLFPFSGQQPMGWSSTILPVICGLACLLLVPASWRTVRIGSALYVLGILVVWVVPSEIGSNMSRLGLIFGGVLLVAIAARAPSLPLSFLALTRLGTRGARFALVLAILTSSIWQVSVAAKDAIKGRPSVSWTVDLAPLVHQLASRNADQGRVEVVPARSHREASALAPHVNLARGWNRQADRERNPIFYRDDLLTSASYRAWLDRWAVRYVVLPTGDPDPASAAEADLVGSGLPYLREVWSDASWRLFAVTGPTPLAEAPAVVTHFDATEIVLTLPRAATVLVRIPDSPWLSLVDSDGKAVESPKSPSSGAPAVNLHGCLSKREEPTQPGEAQDDWTVLHAPGPGTYRIASPYKLPRGTACPEGVD